MPSNAVLFYVHSYITATESELGPGKKVIIPKELEDAFHPFLLTVWTKEGIGTSSPQHKNRNY